MPRKSPHISIPNERLLPRVLGLAPGDTRAWPEDVRTLAEEVAAELFLVRYNPYIAPERVQASVASRLEKAVPTLSKDYAETLSTRVDAFWKQYNDDTAFRESVLARLKEILPAQCIVSHRGSLIETATDATDLRMELPMLMLSPENTEQIQAIVRLAGEMGFAIIPRGGGTGLTGGAIPAHTRTVILSLSRMKEIIDIDEENLILCGQAGVLTLNAIKAAAEQGLLFTVDPASKAGSSLGGNISENSGGPFCFEYGVTLDNIHSYKMVTPSGELIEIRRQDHPRHKIMPEETAVFEILDDRGNVIDVVRLKGDEIRGKNLGKDVSDKYLGGLPGVQKEGVDGVITECCFTLYPKPKLSRTLCLEFFGRSMHNAMLVIKDVVAYRDTIREQGDLVKIAALEEFGPKYVQAIGYEKKSSQYEGEPISVLIVQLDSDDPDALNQAVDAIADIAQVYENVDVFKARDDKEAELFWEDRHKLSAIAKRTSGFKINEDIVIPIDVIPEFSAFLEDMNLFYMARAYRHALKKVIDLPEFTVSDEFIDQEFAYTKKILTGEITYADQSDQELEVQAAYFFKHLQKNYPALTEKIEAIHNEMTATRVMAANHMHAGDGNCHVNFPANSNDQRMLQQVHEAVDKVFAKVMELGGAVSGEHGIGITKIGFLEEDKLEALRKYKAEIDPKSIVNPGKLTQRALTVEPYTFSFNRLIQDLNRTALPDKERLTRLLENVQTCTRCGKCKQVCPMYHPEAGMMFHPRNKNLSLGALVEAIYYSLLDKGKPDKALMSELRELMEHCTACGRCLGVCPVKIDSSHVALHIRAFLEEKKSGGHPIKALALNWLAKAPEKRVPAAAKIMSFGEKIQNRALGFVPHKWLDKVDNPVLTGPTPDLDFKNLFDVLDLGKSPILAPEDVASGRDIPETVFYFPGCGASLFSRAIGMASIYLLIKSGLSVILPDRHLCCGYPLLSQGLEEAWLSNFGNNVARLRKTIERSRRKGFNIGTVLTSCGTCREALHRYGLEGVFGKNVAHKDVVQFLFERPKPKRMGTGREIVYHAACHSEWTGQHPAKAPEAYRSALADYMEASVRLTPGCCGESGLGALTSPGIYNKIRAKKKKQLEADLRKVAADTPVVVGCPSCKMGIKRNLMSLEDEREVLHTVEYLARAIGGDEWKQELHDAIAKAQPQDGVRFVEEL